MFLLDAVNLLLLTARMDAKRTKIPQMEDVLLDIFTMTLLFKLNMSSYLLPAFIHEAAFHRQSLRLSDVVRLPNIMSQYDTAMCPHFLFNFIL